MPSRVGLDALLSFRAGLSLGGVEITRDELEELLSQTAGLSFLKGKWVEIDHQKLQEIMKTNATLTKKQAALYTALVSELVERFNGGEYVPYMCKHVAASLYGIGARFDQDPTLFFLLRNIDFEELIKKSVDEKMNNMLKNAGRITKRVIADIDTAEIFGV
jgi:hypothetical protein